MAGKPHHGGVGQVNAIVIAALLHGGVADFGRQHTYDAELVGTDLERLPHTVAAKGYAVEVIADDADLLVVLHIHILQAAPLNDLVILHFGKVFVHTAHVGPAVAGGTDLQRTAGFAAEVDLRRHRLDQVGMPLADVVHLLHRHGAGAVAPHLNAEGVSAQCGKAVPHTFGHAVAQTHDDDNRHHADDDAQHSQKGAQLVAPHVLDSLPEGFKDHACSSFSGVSGSRVGCTMASGAWESPSYTT